MLNICEKPYLPITIYDECYWCDECVRKVFECHCITAAA